MFFSWNTHSNQERPNEWTINVIPAHQKHCQRAAQELSSAHLDLNRSGGLCYKLIFHLFQGASWAPSTTSLVPTCPHSRRKRWALWGRGSNWHPWLASMRVRCYIAYSIIISIWDRTTSLATNVADAAGPGRRSLPPGFCVHLCCHLWLLGFPPTAQSVRWPSVKLPLLASPLFPLCLDSFSQSLFSW